MKALPHNFSWVTDEFAGSGHPGVRPEMLEEVLATLAGEGIGCIVSLSRLTGRASAAVRQAGFSLIEFPIPDMGVPAIEDLERAVAAALAERDAGRKVLVHCGAGYGRTGLVLACLLVARGLAAQEAIDLVRRKRPGSIETEEQEELVRVWETRKRR